MATSTCASHSPVMDQSTRFLVCLIFLLPVARGLQFLSGGTPLWPCYSVYTVTNTTEFRQVGTPDNPDCAYTFQSPPGTVMTVTVHDLRVTPPNSYYSQPYAGYGAPPPTSNDCNSEAVRIYDYQQDGSLVVAATICNTVNTGDPVNTSRNYGVVTSTVTKGGFYLTVALMDAPGNDSVSELVPPEAGGEGAAEEPTSPASATTEETSRGESEASRMETAATTEQVTREIPPATPQSAPPTLTPSTTAASTTSSSTAPTTTSTTTSKTTSTSTTTSTTPGTTTDAITASTTLSVSATESTTETDIRPVTDTGIIQEVPAPVLGNSTEVTVPVEVITTETPATNNDLKATVT